MARKISIVIAGVLFLFSQSGHLFAQTAAFKKAEILILKGAYQKAARECEKILAHHHRTTIKSRAGYLLGICLLKQGEYERARKNFQKILAQNRSSRFYDDASLGIADSYFLAGSYKQATKEYEQFLQNFRRSELTSIARVHLEQCKQGSPYADSCFSVQLGCFTNKSNAQRLRNDLIDSGYQAYILELPGESFSRVRVGKFSNRLEAEFLEQRLKSEGYSTKVCP